MGAAMAVLRAGAPLHRHDIHVCGIPDLKAMLEDWAMTHPEKVVE